MRDIEVHNFGTGDFDPAEFPFDPQKPDDLREGGNFVLGTRAAGRSQDLLDLEQLGES